jgi:hypothetical protein
MMRTRISDNKNQQVTPRQKGERERKNQENLPPGSIVTERRNAVEQGGLLPKLLKGLTKDGSHEGGTRKIQALANSFTACSLPKQSSVGPSAAQWDHAFFDQGKKYKCCPGRS